MLQSDLPWSDSAAGLSTLVETTELLFTELEEEVRIRPHLQSKHGYAAALVALH